MDIIRRDVMNRCSQYLSQVRVGIRIKVGIRVRFGIRVAVRVRHNKAGRYEPLQSISLPGKV
jgi:hypothetical protein